MLSTTHLSRADILHLFDRARHFEGAPKSKLLKGKTMAMLFDEPSTRTMMSFQRAMYNLGGKVIAVHASAMAKGESIRDTVQTLECFADVIVLRLRQPLGALTSAAPVINAGDGANEHPTQALQDAYTIWKRFGANARVTLFGDLRYSRTVRSLVPLLKKLDYVVTLVPGSPELSDPRLGAHQSAIPQSDVVYVTRPQVERWPEPRPGTYVLPKQSSDVMILHPLPRTSELPGDLPESVVEQVRNGVFIRMAILEWCFAQSKM